MASFACRCSMVSGNADGAAPGTVNRVVCYCDDCQAFAHYLGRPDILNVHGGSDIVQIAPATLHFEQGQEHISGVRLTPKGLYRWYATCCNTPLGNTVSPSIPLVGIVVTAFTVNGQSADDLLGRVTGAILARHAIGKPPYADLGLGAGQILRAIGKILRWRLSGQSWPNPFFDRATLKPIYPFTVVAPERREELRALCGPCRRS